MKMKDAKARVKAAVTRVAELRAQIAEVEGTANGKAASKRALKQSATLRTELEEAVMERRRARVCLRRAGGAVG